MAHLDSKGSLNDSLLNEQVNFLGLILALQNFLQRNLDANLDGGGRIKVKEGKRVITPYYEKQINK